MLAFLLAHGSAAQPRNNTTLGLKKQALFKWDLNFWRLPVLYCYAHCEVAHNLLQYLRLCATAPW